MPGGSPWSTARLRPRRPCLPSLRPSHHRFSWLESLPSGVSVPFCVPIRLSMHIRVVSALRLLWTPVRAQVEGFYGAESAALFWPQCQGLFEDFSSLCVSKHVQGKVSAGPCEAPRFRRAWLQSGSGSCVRSAQGPHAACHVQAAEVDVPSGQAGGQAPCCRHQRPGGS